MALEWLDKMSRSMRQVSYQGVVTLQRGDEMQVMQVSHSVDHGSSSERLTVLTGQGAQVVRGSHPLNCIHPGDQLLRLGTLLQRDHCGIAGQYRLSVADGERVAGRNAVRIIIEPRDMYRFGYVIALDRETGLLLKSQTISHGHKALETIQFAHISYATDVPVVGEAGRFARGAASASPKPCRNSAVARAWSLGWLPRGFAATDSSLGILGRRTYTDGLAVFSVFLEDLDRQIHPGEGLVRAGWHHDLYPRHAHCWAACAGDCDRRGAGQYGQNGGRLSELGAVIYVDRNRASGRYRSGWTLG